jgi:hypothetical protein
MGVVDNPGVSTVPVSKSFQYNGAAGLLTPNPEPVIRTVPLWDNVPETELMEGCEKGVLMRTRKLITKTKQPK